MIRIIRISDNKKTVQYDFLFPLPSGTNAAGLTWLEAVNLTGEYETEDVSSVVHLKQRRHYRFVSADLTNAQRLTALTSLNTSLMATAASVLTDQLNHTGREILDS